MSNQYSINLIFLDRFHNVFFITHATFTIIMNLACFKSSHKHTEKYIRKGSIHVNALGADTYSHTQLTLSYLIK